MRRAITLYELLIVVVVTVILAWILIPVFSESKAASHNNQDLANMREIAQSAMMYTDDHDDRYVPVGAPATDYRWSPARDASVDAAGRPWNGWGLKLAAYKKNPAFFRSPLAADKGRFEGDCSHADGMAVTNTYALNWLLGRDGSFTEEGYAASPSGIALNRPITTESVHRPQNTIALMASEFISGRGEDRACLRATLKASDFTIRISIPTAYDRGGNLAFVDGHTRWYQAQGAAPDSNEGPIYDWPSRGFWMQPTMPEDPMGYRNGNGIR